ncbi:MAG: undecaprenyldiphospho-muramoylpentapeptide beta-N-acetylglucosaminyltransferase [Legionella sp.]|jgi:UDP-N-acetylglucosamine--N-acetylmuramyl-(pentapeptide) pyrophosphoryl-undecaprenol N-acetylglucosamine transferase|nr:undecaprenyldiphospho-muramoylpentapeptide beta-N-acetylglucosaminyltransferase [Legionella sp.]
MNKRIVFTGGGTAGHVIPNLVLMGSLDKKWQIDYIGSGKGIEASMIKAKGLPFHPIRSGKLRRYFSWQNFVDPLNIFIGMLQSYRLLGKLKTDVVFSKGGFVAFPVVVAAWLRRIPVIAHESDMTPGLANRLSFPFVSKICVAFKAAQSHFKNATKVEMTGNPIRAELLEGNRLQGLTYCGFNESKPCILFVGGSQGAKTLNDVLRASLPTLCETYQVIHLCGSGKLDPTLAKKTGYFQMEYADDILPHLYAAADIVVSRSGANTLYELLALKKPHLLIPLSSLTSRGEQLQNANHFKSLGMSEVRTEESLTPKILIDAIEAVMATRLQKIEKMQALALEPANQKILRLIEAALPG